MARDFAMIVPSFWTGESGKQLRGNPWAQILALYVMSCDQSCMTGIFKIASSTICKETGIPSGEFDDAAAHLYNLGILEYDHESEIMWVQNLAKFQVGSCLQSGDTKRRSIVKKLRWAKNHYFTAMFFEKYGNVYGLCVEDLELSNEALAQKLLDTPCHGEDDHVLLNSSLKIEKSNNHAKRGARIPNNWTPGPSTGIWCVGKGVKPKDYIEEFRNYWESKPGQAGTKLDWEKTFMNWILNDLKRNPKRSTNNRPSSSSFDPFPEGNE